MRSRALLLSLGLALASESAAAAVKPPTPDFAKAIDGFASYVSQTTCDPTAKPGVVDFKNLILATYSVTGDYGIVRACNVGGTSEHKEGRAWDWKVNYFNATQKDIAGTVIDWLLETDKHGNACAIARRVGMMYFIWNKEIWGAYRSPNGSCATAGWKGYTGTNPHTDHVHFSWSWAGAKKQTTWWTAPLPPAPVNQKPTGTFDGANCKRVWGWSQDPDAPKKGIDVHLYFGGPAGDKSAVGVPVPSNLNRDDLCTPLGSCNHGFEVASPLSLFDGKPHAVHAYAIDSAGGANAELQKSPKTMQCDAVVPAGVRRLLKDQASFDTWGFSDFWDVMPLTDAALTEIPEGPGAPDAPLLVKSDDGSPEVWLIDGNVRRHVPNAAIFDVWGFDWNAIVTWAAADLNQFSQGPNVRDRPVLVQGSGASVYLIDDDISVAPPPAGLGGSGGEGGSIGPGTGADGGSSATQKTRVLGDEGGGCGCRVDDSRPRPIPWVIGLSVLALTLLRRRRR